MTSIVTEGNATSDSELRFTQSGKAVANVTLAVTDRTRDAGGVGRRGDRLLRGHRLGQPGRILRRDRGQGRPEP